jgi:hypothetical protein
MEAILNKYEIDTKEEFFEGIFNALNVGANQLAKDMFDELTTDEMKQEFKQWFSIFTFYDRDDMSEEEAYNTFIQYIKEPITNN